MDHPGAISAPAHEIYWIRARLPIAVIQEDWDEVKRLAEQAERLAIAGWASMRSWRAAWAIATRDSQVNQVKVALGEMTEPYTAARLAVDFLSVSGSHDAELIAETEVALTDMGALASLSHLASES